MAKKETIEANNHHFVAKFYLKGFWQEYKVAYYERDTRTAGEKHPDHLASGPNFYERVNQFGVRDLEAEKELSKVEDRAARVFKRLKERKSITPQQRFSLAEFMSIAYTRTPDHIETLRHLREQYQKIVLEKRLPTEDAVLKLIQEHLPQHEHEYAQNLAHRVFVNAHTKPLFDNTNIAVESMIQAKRITPYLFNRTWRIIDAEPGENFITSDSPLIPLWEEDRTLKDFSDASFVAFPLTKDQLIFMEGFSPSLSYHQSPKEWTQRLNIEIATQSKNYLFGNNKDKLLKLKDLINLDGVPWQPKKSFEDIIFTNPKGASSWPPPEL